MASDPNSDFVSISSRPVLEKCWVNKPNTSARKPTPQAPARKPSARKPTHQASAPQSHRVDQQIFRDAFQAMLKSYHAYETSEAELVASALIDMSSGSDSEVDQEPNAKKARSE